MSQLKDDLRIKKQASGPIENQNSKPKKRISVDVKNNPSSRENKLKPILISMTPGNAIMGYTVEDLPSKKLPPLQEVNMNKNPNQRLEAKVESSIIQMLQEKCTELAKEAEEDKASRKQAELENMMLKSRIINLENEMRNFMHIMDNEKSDKYKSEENTEKIKEMLNRANREIGRMKQDLKVANENTEKLKKELINLKNERQEEARSYEDEIDRLRKNLEELEEEHQELKSHYQIKQEITTRVEEQSGKIVKEIEAKAVSQLEEKTQKINKLVSENAVLKEKLYESEKLRRKYEERHAFDQDKIKSLVAENENLENCVGSLKKQLGDSKSLKSYNHKMYEERISVLNETIDKLKKENNKLKKGHIPTSPTNNVGTEASNEESLEPVKAKPYLFGPIDNNRF